MLEALERGNLFVIPLDDQRQWYRYHHLFAEVLLAHLQEAQPDRVSMLHLRASEWYERNGQQSDAVRHALAAGDFERSAGLIELAGPWTEDGSIQQAIWLGWIKRLPEELIRVRPVLNVWYAYVLLGSGELEAAESRFGDAERWLESADTIFAETLHTAEVSRVLLGRAIEGWSLQTRSNSNLYRRQLPSVAPISLRRSAIFQIQSGTPTKHLSWRPKETISDAHRHP